MCMNIFMQNSLFLKFYPLQCFVVYTAETFRTVFYNLKTKGSPKDPGRSTNY